MLKKILLASVLSLATVSALNAEVQSATQLLQEASKTVTSIDTAKIEEILKKNRNIRIIDIRSTEDIVDQDGYIMANKRTSVVRDKLEFLIGDLVKEDEEFIIHCYDGKMSLLAAQRLKSMGYKNVLHYKDSFKGWKEEGLPTRSLDKYKKSLLYSEVREVADGVYASVGATLPYLYESTAHNNNLGFIVGDKSVLVWNASSSYMLAQALHKEIKEVTNLPVKYVVIENSQGHAMLGTSYWQEQGVEVIAQEIVKEEYNRLGESIFIRMENALKDKFTGTKLSMPDKFFKDNMTFDLGNKIVEAKYFGYAHEHSDIMLWLPKEKIAFAGDIAFNNRLLPIFKITQTKKWLEAWDKFEALKPEIVIPGHGDITDLATVRKYTQGYLLYMRAKIEEVMDDDGGLKEAYEIDQTPYEHLDTFKELSTLNAATLFEQMEFED